MRQHHSHSLRKEGARSGLSASRSMKSAAGVSENGTLPTTDRYFTLEEKTISGWAVARAIWWSTLLIIGVVINRPSLQIFALFWLLCAYAETHVLVEQAVKP